jgi:hypothetical protein
LLLLLLLLWLLLLLSRPTELFWPATPASTMKRKGRGTSRIGLHALRGATSQGNAKAGKGSSQASTTCTEQQQQSRQNRQTSKGSKVTGKSPKLPLVHGRHHPRQSQEVTPRSWLLLLSIPTRSCCPLSLPNHQKKMISIPYTLMSCSKTFKKAPVSTLPPSPKQKKNSPLLNPPPRANLAASVKSLHPHWVLVGSQTPCVGYKLVHTIYYIYPVIYY